MGQAFTSRSIFCKKIIIFGIKDFASLAHFYIRNDSSDLVEAFTVSKEFMPENAWFEDKPIVEFEYLKDIYPPEEYILFAPMADNKIREKIYLAGKKIGYSFYSYLSSHATIWPGAEIGDNTFLLEGNNLQPYTTIGNNCVLWSNNHLGHHSKIGDHVSFTSEVCMSGHCEIGDYSYLGVNSTIRDGIKLAEGTIVGMSACVTKDTEAWSTYIGVPAKKKGK